MAPPEVATSGDGRPDDDGLARVWICTASRLKKQKTTPFSDRTRAALVLEESSFWIFVGIPPLASIKVLSTAQAGLSAFCGSRRVRGRVTVAKPQCQRHCSSEVLEASGAGSVFRFGLHALPTGGSRVC